MSDSCRMYNFGQAPACQQSHRGWAGASVLVVRAPAVLPCCLLDGRGPCAQAQGYGSKRASACQAGTAAGWCAGGGINSR